MPNEQEKLQHVLHTAYQSRFVVNSSSDLVVEGYPRSANTYCVNCIERAARLGGRSLRIAHHTHDIRNVELGIFLECPVLVLIRDPACAIASYALYMDLPIKSATAQYMTFYERLLSLPRKYVAVDFSVVVGGINRVLKGLSDEFALELGVFQDPARASIDIVDELRSRSVSHHGNETFIRKGSVPDDNRAQFSKAMRAEVAEYLARNPEATAVYAEVLKSSPRIK